MPCALWLIIYLFEGKGQGRSFFSAGSSPKITLTPFNGLRSTCDSMRRNVCRLLKRLLLRGCKPGAARQPLTFFCLPTRPGQKKVSKEKATAQPLPAFGGSPNEAGASRMGHKLASLKHVSHNSRLAPAGDRREGNVRMRGTSKATATPRS